MWNKPRSRWWGLCLLVILVTGCQSQSSSGDAARQPTVPPASTKPTETNNPSSAGQSPSPAQLVVDKWTNLPEALIGNALAASPQAGVYSVGGYNGKHSIDIIYRLADKVSKYAKIPRLMHDEAAGWIGGELYMIGGGQNDSYDTVYKMTSDKQVKLAGHLPLPASDLSAVPYTLRGRSGLMIVGGYDGKTYDKKVRMLQTQGQGLDWVASFQLPDGFRYGAVTTNGHEIFMAGGKTPSGLSDKIYAWSDREKRLRLLATLPGAREKAAAFVFGTQLWIVGGMDVKGKVLDQVVKVNTETGQTEIAPPFPTPIADMGYTQDQDTGYLAGGQISGKQYASAVYKIKSSQP